MTYFLLSPLLWGLLLSAVLVARWRRLRAWSRTLLMVAAATCWLACTPLGANALVAWAEARLPESARCEPLPAAPIVVLAGGFARTPRAADDFTALTPESWRRLHAAALLQRRHGGVLWIVGGGPYPIRESDVLALLAVDWRVPVTEVRVENHSQTTREGAIAMRGNIPERFILVSSAIHLPRAVQAFRDAGFSPCAVASSSDFIAPGSFGDLLPQGPAITKSQAALHELAGSLAYRIGGKD